MEFYGGVGDNVTDNTPALTAALAAGETHLCAGPGYYRFNTLPPALNGIHIEGAGVSNTAFVKAFNNGVLMDFVGNAANGGGISDMSIVANDSTGGTLLRVISTLGSPASYTHFENLNFTYAGTANYDLAIDIDGNQANTAAQGVRTPKFINITAFQPTGKDWAIKIKNAISPMWANIWTNGSIMISGLYTQFTTTTSLSFSNIIAGDAIYIESAVGISIMGQCNRLYAQPTAANGIFVGLATNVFNSSPSFKVYNRP